ncbi:DUF1214 domain-containing protein [Lysobacter panacisoli]|uniref:DUF1254 domain-containing protein n=1 Tax=Lysobacter panacisoli TaxID=1255263 RepID=A0ABP9LQY4_9GAMM|nr:DUF1214 domain-containing protein [Lysobacter panacisoli]
MKLVARTVTGLGIALLVMTGCQKPAEPSATAPAAAPETSANAVSDQDITDAYLYLLGRLLVLRQEQLDFGKEGIKWNEITHRDVGGVAWANPNLDVAYSEAWIAVDENSCTIFSVPKIEGRYYTVQFLNGWGETIANINERTFADHPSGDFWACLKGANVQVPADARRIDLPGKTARVLARVELGADSKKAAALQHQIKVHASGTPNIAEVPKTPDFPNSKLPGVEAFDAATVEAALSEPDINRGMDAQQAKVRAVAAAIADPAQRERVDKVIREQAQPAMHKALVDIGTKRDGWARPDVAGNYGDDYLARTVVDFGGIWANNREEVVYFKTNTDGTGTPLDGANTYTLKFAKGDLPADHVKYFWSVIAVDDEKFQVIPNAKNRFLLNKESKLTYDADGSLTLYLAPEKPKDAADGNWLPTPKGKNYHLTFRMYGPDEAVLSGKWFPAAITKQG